MRTSRSHSSSSPPVSHAPSLVMFSSCALMSGRANSCACPQRHAHAAALTQNTHAPRRASLPPARILCHQLAAHVRHVLLGQPAAQLLLLRRMLHLGSGERARAHPAVPARRHYLSTHGEQQRHRERDHGREQQPGDRPDAHRAGAGAARMRASTSRRHLQRASIFGAMGREQLSIRSRKLAPLHPCPRFAALRPGKRACLPCLLTSSRLAQPAPVQAAWPRTTVARTCATRGRRGWSAGACAQQSPVCHSRARRPLRSCGRGAPAAAAPPRAAASTACARAVASPPGPSRLPWRGVA